MRNEQRKQRERSDLAVERQRSALKRIARLKPALEELEETDVVWLFEELRRCRHECVVASVWLFSAGQQRLFLILLASGILLKI